MKNKQSYLVGLVLIASAMAFVYLNSCGLPVELAESNANILDQDLLKPDYSSMADVKVVQFIVKKLVQLVTFL